MLSKALEIEILKSLNLLEKEQQDRIFNYIRSLQKKSKSVPTNLLQFAGSSDLQELGQSVGD
jgi:hypothetical protein